MASLILPLPAPSGFLAVAAEAPIILRDARLKATCRGEPQAPSAQPSTWRHRCRSDVTAPSCLDLRPVTNPYFTLFRHRQHMPHLGGSHPPSTGGALK